MAKIQSYAYSQLAKISDNPTKQDSKRAASVEKFGYDVKAAYHVVRLLNEIEQILVEGDLDLLRNREQLKSIRRGEWTIEQLNQYFTEKEILKPVTPHPHCKLRQMLNKLKHCYCLCLKNIMEI